MSYFGFLAQVVYKSVKCWNDINIIHMSSMILKRAKSSSRDAKISGLNTHKRRFWTI